MASSKLSRAVRLCTKLGILGGAVYLTTANGVWGRDTEQSIKSLQQFSQSVDDKLGGSYLTQVKPTKFNLGLTEKWNYGVATSIGYISEMPNKVSSGCSQGLEYISNQWK